MRKLILIILLLILFILSIVSRNFGEVGIKTGLNSTDLHLSIRIPYVTFDSRRTWLCGLYYSFDIFKHVSIQPEIFYAPEGGISHETLSEVAVTIHHRLSYVKVPLLVKLTPPVGSIVKTSFFIGPYTAYLLKAKAEENAFEEKKDIDLKPYIKKWDLGLVVGAGLEASLKRVKLSLEARYSVGLTDIAVNYKELYHEFTGKDSIKNSAFVILIGAGFNLRK